MQNFQHILNNHSQKVYYVRESADKSLHLSQMVQIDKLCVCEGVTAHTVPSETPSCATIILVFTKITYGVHPPC
jgi:hypothetical protein